MKIVQAVHGYPPELTGGIERHVQTLARALAAAGHDVVVVAGTLRAQCADRAVESERSEPATEEIPVESTAVSAPELTLDESKFVEIPHKNKYGLDYPASAYETGRR